jgi:hypothetical protein
MMLKFEWWGQGGLEIRLACPMFGMRREAQTPAKDAIPVQPSGFLADVMSCAVEAACLAATRKKTNSRSHPHITHPLSGSPIRLASLLSA